MGCRFRGDAAWPHRARRVVFLQFGTASGNSAGCGESGFYRFVFAAGLAMTGARNTVFQVEPKVPAATNCIHPS
jgi:hypothetical protein